MIEFQCFLNLIGTLPGHLTEDDIGGAVGDDAENGRLIVVETIHGTGDVPTIKVSAPTKVEMEIAIRFVSITDEGVATNVTMAAVHDGMIGRNIGAEHIVPHRIRERGFRCIAEVGTEAEEVNQSGAGVEIVTAAFVGSITHIGCHAAVAHQSGNSVDFLRGAGGGEGIGHVGVVVGGAVVINRKGAIDIVIIAVDAAAVDGVAPVVDDLGHGGGDTAGNTMTSGTGGVFGTESVVVLALVPGGGEEGTHRIREIRGS